MNGYEAAFPVTETQRSDGMITQYGQAGMAIKSYIIIEMAKALIGRKDSMLFSKQELAQQALEMANAILEVLP